MIVGCGSLSPTSPSCESTVQASHPENALIAGDGCYRCSRETRNFGAFATEVLAVVDAEKTRGTGVLLLSHKVLGESEDDENYSAPVVANYISQKL